MNVEYNLTDKELRNFGLMFGGIIAAIFGLFFPLVFNTNWWKWPWIIGVIFSAWGLLLPATLQLFYKIWMKFGLVMNWIMTRIILGFVFYLVIFPIGLLMKLFGKDSMNRDLKDTYSYRIESKSYLPEDMKRPF